MQNRGSRLTKSPAAEIDEWQGLEPDAESSNKEQKQVAATNAASEGEHRPDEPQKGIDLAHSTMNDPCRRLDNPWAIAGFSNTAITIQKRKQTRGFR